MNKSERCLAALLIVCLLGRASFGQGRPIIVLVHGRAQEYQIAAVMEHAWRSALRDGLSKIGMDSTVLHSDVMFVHYEYVTEHAAQTHLPCTGSIPDLPNNSPGFFVGLNLDWYLSGPRSKNLVQTRDKIARWGWVQQMVIASLPDVQRYLDASPTDPVRCETERPLKLALDSARRMGRPVILVAHSLGSLIAYRVLAEARMAQPAEPNFYNVQRLVTFGSQLNLEAIQRRLIPGQSLPPMPPAWTPPVRWINLAGYGDYIASSPQRSQLPRRSDSLHREFEIFTRPGSPHAFEGYLKHVATAQSIAAGWCRAFAEQPAACNTLTEVPVDSFPVDTVDLPKLWLAVGVGVASVGGRPDLSNQAATPGLRLLSSFTTPLFPLLMRLDGWHFLIGPEMEGYLDAAAIEPVITPVRFWRVDVHAGIGREVMWARDLTDCSSCRRWGSVRSAGLTIAGDHWMIPLEIHRLSALPTPRGGSVTVLSAAFAVREIPIWK